MIVAYLGNFEGVIELSYPFVWARTKVSQEIGGTPKLEEVIIKNERVVPNVYDLAVKVFDGRVVGIYGSKE